MNKIFKIKLTIVSVTPIFVYSIFCILGLVRFKLWQGAVNIWEWDLTLAEIFAQHAGIRFLLVLPLFKLSEWLGISYNWLFSITIPFLIYLITFFSARSIQQLNPQISSQNRAIQFIGISLFFIFLSLFMNGRLMFAFAGTSILMWSLLNWDNNRDKTNLLAVLTAIFLSCVSRGTFLVTVVSFCFFLTVNIVIAKPSICRRKIIIIYSILLAVLIPYLIILVLKLLDKLGGGIGALEYLLSHGYGAVVMRSHFIILLASVFFFLLLGYIYRKTLYRYWILASLMFFSLAGGMFGISTALTILPPLLVTISLVTLQLAARVQKSYLVTVLKKKCNLRCY